MRQLGLELQTLFGMPPVAHARLAAELDCQYISTALSPVPWKLDCFADWSLRTDPVLRREFQAVLRDQGIAIALAEGFAIRASRDVRLYAKDLDIMAALGAQAISTVCLDGDITYGWDQLATLWEMVNERGMRLHLEFAPPHSINTLNKALAALDALGAGTATLLLDTMHFFRTGATLSSLADIPPHLIGHVQLCDAAFAPTESDYFREACFNRMLPGLGELPLREFIQGLPAHIPLGLEVPIRQRLTCADDVRHVATEAVARTRQLI